MSAIRFIFFLFFLLGCSMISEAQDIIHHKNGTEIKSKVTEITSTEILYKRWENPDGPVYHIRKSDVFKIVYENGLEEKISNGQAMDTKREINFSPNANNIIKLNTLPVAVGAVNVFYELAIGKKISAIAGFNYLPRTVNYSYTVTGFTGELRFYFTNLESVNGFYLGPTVKYKERKGDIYLLAPPQTTYIGGISGFQRVLRNGVALDFFMGGGLSTRPSQSQAYQMFDLLDFRMGFCVGYAFTNSRTLKKY